MEVHSTALSSLWWDLRGCSKKFSRHLKRILGDIRLTFEEIYTVLSQIESCMNSRPLVTVGNDGDGTEVLTPGHYLIGQPLMALPDSALPYQSLSILRCWNLCQIVTGHFWKRWSLEYLTLQKNYKWMHPSRNFSTGDVVVLIEDGMLPTQWPLARVIKTHPRQDGTVHVVDVKTSKGSYHCPTHKVAIILPGVETN